MKKITISISIVLSIFNTSDIVNFYLDVLFKMAFVPYFLCKQIIYKSMGDEFTYHDVVDMLDFKNDLIYKKNDRVPILEYYDLIYRAEKSGFNILKIYDKKEDVLSNFSSVFPQFGLVCLNSESLMTAIKSYLLLSGGSEHNKCELRRLNDNKIEITFFPPHEKLNSSIYLPLGNMIILLGLVRFYISNPNNYKVTMNFVSGSQPSFEREITRDLKCEVNFNRIKTSITINTPSLNDRFKNYNPALSQVKERCNLKPFITQEMDIIKDVDFIESIAVVIRGFYHSNFDGKCSIEYVSSKINIPVWTLQRQLSKIKRTYSEILNNVLLELSMSHLYEGKHSIRYISELLGFSSQASFTRFFKSMTGMTPLVYRKECND
ncbi:MULTISPECIES: helix-turn-helix domain-containing protein [Gammaproteobacteria]|uniref:helix-turn-helix domain-containing protein n=1 Tax=Gammaproteobacteria TaxID=1236 RepID=UPI002EA5734C|nr:AraC family transcriptional regulator [Vibrio sp. YYF0003]